MTLLAVLAVTGVCGAADQLSVEELKSMLGRPEVVVVDLRTGVEWAGSLYKVPHAVHEDATEVPSWAARYAKDAIMVLYCS
jgi:hypothetical protein